MAEDKKEDTQKEKSQAENKEKNSQPSFKIEKEFYWLIGIILALVVVFLITLSILQGLKTFDYQGLSFTKVKYGDTYFYQYDYYVRDTSGNINRYYLNLQQDPRENNVPIEGEISFDIREFVYFSINETGLKQCSYGEAAVGALAGFLTGNHIQVRASVPDEAEAIARGVKYANCTHSPIPDRPVIFLEASNETRITKENKCYRIQVNNCEVFPAVEKFMVQTLIDARESALTRQNQTNFNLSL